MGAYSVGSGDHYECFLEMADVDGSSMRYAAFLLLLMTGMGFGQTIAFRVTPLECTMRIDNVCFMWDTSVAPVLLAELPDAIPYEPLVPIGPIPENEFSGTQVDITGPECCDAAGNICAALLILDGQHHCLKFGVLGD